MKYETLSVGMLEVNCFIIWNEETRQALIIDPGGDYNDIVSQLEKHRLSVKGILLTHGHFDHIGAVPALVERFHIPVYLHPDDMELYNSPANCMLPWIHPIQNPPAVTDTPPEVPGLEYEIIHTPGHAKGAVCYFFRKERELFAGDTLFRRSVGRTDLPGGDHELLLRSIKEKLYKLPETIVVHSGHGPDTTIGEEKRENSFTS